MTVKDFATTVYEPKAITVCLRNTDFALVPDGGKMDTTLLEMLGNYVLEDFIADEKNTYLLSIKEIPVKEGM